MNQNSNGPLTLAGVVFVVSVAAFVALEVLGHDTSGLMVLVGPAIGALIVSGQLTGQNKALDKIEKQTNGVMDKRIEDGVGRALQRAGVLAINPGTSTPVEPVLPPAQRSPATAADLPEWAPAHARD